jgi:hypothetical protein
MKNLFNKIAWGVLSIGLAAACAPDEPISLNENAIPSISAANITISADSNNVVTFHLENKELVPVWIFQGGDQIAQNDYKRTFAVPGSYSVYLKVLNKNGVSQDSVKHEFTVEGGPYIKFLAGTGSKTWVWDPSVGGHFGCGPSGGNGLGWSSAGPNEKAGTGMYDDQLTFKTDMSYVFSPGVDGKIYVNKDSRFKPEFYANNGQDYDAPCETVTTTYTLKQEGNNLYLVFPANTMISYIPNPEAMSNPKYKILTLNANLMELAADNGGIAWHYRFKAKAN